MAHEQLDKRDELSSFVAVSAMEDAVAVHLQIRDCMATNRSTSGFHAFYCNCFMDAGWTNLVSRLLLCISQK